MPEKNLNNMSMEEYLREMWPMERIEHVKKHLGDAANRVDTRAWLALVELTDKMHFERQKQNTRPFKDGVDKAA